MWYIMLTQHLASRFEVVTEISNVVTLLLLDSMFKMCALVLQLTVFLKQSMKTVGRKQQSSWIDLKFNPDLGTSIFVIA